MVELLGHPLHLQLFLLEFPVCLGYVLEQKLCVLAWDESALAISFIAFILHELEPLNVEGDQGKGGASLPLLVEVFKDQGELVFFGEELWVRVQDNLPDHDVQPIVSLFVRVHPVAENGILLLGLVGL